MSIKCFSLFGLCKVLPTTSLSKTSSYSGQFISKFYESSLTTKGTFHDHSALPSSHFFTGSRDDLSCSCGEINCHGHSKRGEAASRALWGFTLKDRYSIQSLWFDLLIFIYVIESIHSIIYIEHCN